MEYKNLVFEGGGVLGIAYVGALDVLHQQNKLDSVERVAGTSAGSIVAMLLALRYSYPEIHSIMSNLDFANFEDDPDPLRLLTRYGYYEGAFALHFLQSLVERKLESKNATFADLRDLGGRDLKVFGTNLSTHESQEFSFATSPDMPIATAVRISMSIPLFFAALEINGDVFADGGTVFNYPITVFNDEPPDQTLGFRFEGGPTPENNAFGYDHPFDYIKSLFETILATQAAFYKFNVEDQKRSISIPTGGVSPIDFTLDEADKELLFTNGQKATEAYLKGLSGY